MKIFDVLVLVSVPHKVNERYPDSYRLENEKINVDRVNHTEEVTKKIYKVGDVIILQ